MIKTWYVYANKATNGDIAWNKLLWHETTNTTHLSVHD